MTRTPTLAEIGDAMEAVDRGMMAKGCYEADVIREALERESPIHGTTGDLLREAAIEGVRQFQITRQELQRLFDHINDLHTLLRRYTVAMEQEIDAHEPEFPDAHEASADDLDDIFNSPTALSQAEVDRLHDMGAYFGACPVCGDSGSILTLRPKDHYGVCVRHGVRWAIGANLFSDWTHMTPEDFDRNERIVNALRDVEAEMRPDRILKLRAEYEGSLRRVAQADGGWDRCIG